MYIILALLILAMALIGFMVYTLGEAFTELENRLEELEEDVYATDED